MENVMLAFMLLLNIGLLHAVPSSNQIKTPSGRLIPHSVFTNLFPEIPVHILHERLYEVTPDFKVLSSGSVVDLINHINQSKEIPAANSIVYINGELSLHRPRGYIQEGNGYSIVTKEDVTVISIKTPGKIYKPVNLSSYPGLFVSVHSNETIEFRNDEKEVPKTADAGVDSGNVEVANAEPSCRGSDAPPQFVELAVAIDSALCAKYASAADAEVAVRGVISSGEAVYSAKMCIRFHINVIDIRCDPATDPYASIIDPLDDFRAVWGTLPVSNVQRDAVLFVTGTNFLSGVAGQAYVGVTCLQSFSFMWIDLLSGLIFAHEMGHNLNANHVDTGVMKASINLGTDNFFSEASVDTIVAFVDAETSRSICIEGVAASPTSTSTVIPSPMSTESTVPSVSASGLPSSSLLPSAAPSLSPAASASESAISSVSGSVPPTVSSSLSLAPSSSSSADVSPSLTSTAAVSPSSSNSIFVSSSPNSSPSTTSIASVSPVASASSSIAPPPPTTSSPSAVVTPGTRSCNSLLLQRQSFKCGVSAVFSAIAPISYKSQNVQVKLKILIRQSYGITLYAMTPRFIAVGARRNKKILSARMTTLQTLGSFSPLTQAELTTVTSKTYYKGRKMYGVFNLGELAAPSGAFSCCNSRLYVAAVITIQLREKRSTTVVKVFVTRSVTLRCVQYEECSRIFLPMSQTTKCPVCRS